MVAHGGRRLWVAAWGTLTLVTLSLATPRSTSAEVCLPSLAEQGRRLHEMPAPSVFWLELLLRQHEACWTADQPHDQLRVFFYGSSAVMGEPWRTEDTVTEHLNAIWKSIQVPAHAFNFGFGTTHATKDMLIVRESLRYHPDVIVYGAVPADFSRWIAAQYRRGAALPYLRLVRLMRNSAPTLLEFAAEHPAGLERPLKGYLRRLDGFERSWTHPWTWPVRDVGAFVYTTLATRLRRAGGGWLGIVEPLGEPTAAVLEGYSCRATHLENRRDYRRWGEINSLAYLAEVRDRTGIPVVVVDWPITAESSGDCFNEDVTNSVVRGYRGWLRAEAQRLGLPLIDLSQTLFSRDFLDSLHPNARGQRKIAGALHPQLLPLLRQRITEVFPPT